MAYSLKVKIIKNWVNDTQLKIEENRNLENMSLVNPFLSCLETGEVCMIYGQVFFFHPQGTYLKRRNIYLYNKRLCNL